MLSTAASGVAAGCDGDPRLEATLAGGVVGAVVPGGSPGDGIVEGRRPRAPGSRLAPFAGPPRLSRKARRLSLGREIATRASLAALVSGYAVVTRSRRVTAR